MRLPLISQSFVCLTMIEVGKATVQTALHFGVGGLDLRVTDGGELTRSYSDGGEVKMTKQEVIEMIERAGFEAVERGTVYNRAEKVAV